jgi:hypothetical protein
MNASCSFRHARLAFRSILLALAVIAIAIAGSAGAPNARADVVLTVDHATDIVIEGQTVDFKFTLTNNTGAAINNLAAANGGPGNVLPDPKDHYTSITIAGLPAMLAAGASVTYTATVHTGPLDFDGDAGVNLINNFVTYNAPSQSTNTVPITVVVIDLNTPEIAPGPMAGAVALLVGGVLSLTDRRRRK